MPDQMREIHGVPVFVCDPDGKPMAGEGDVLDLLGQMYGLHVSWVVIPVDRLVSDFFRLRTGIAGEIVQKFVQYQNRVAIVGDISAQLAESGPLRDWVRESNLGRDVWFVSTVDEFTERLAARV
jgi:hypothetical protein